MRRNLRVEEVRLGMFVILPVSWTAHPFLRNRFKITDPEQLAKLRASPLSEVTVDFERSDTPPPEPVAELACVSHDDNVADPKEQAPPPEWNPDTLVPPDLVEAIRDQRLPPEQKSRAVHHHTREMMRRLLETPSPENIHASRTAIGLVSELILSDDATAQNLLRITTHDFYTYTHSVNVGVKGLMLCKALFASSDGHDLHELGAGFFLHDLGKVKVDPAVINKPGRLTEDEMRHMRIHPYQGYKLLRDAGVLSEECRIIVMEHHELINGGGYPKRIGGDQIHLYGRICCIADVFDALTAERSYKKAMKPFDALTLMRDKMANHFDRALFARFVELFR